MSDVQDDNLKQDNDLDPAGLDRLQPDERGNSKANDAEHAALATDPYGTLEAAVNQDLIEQDLFWVGIGASAGGLEALRALVSNLPQEPEHATVYIVAQHLSPNHESMLAQLLGRDASLPVRVLTDGERPLANTIYITPPEKDVFVSGGVMHLRAPSSEFGPKPSVDYFLTTLAEDQKHHAVGVILSGTGLDGSHGIRAVRAAGGITFSQDIDSAKFDGMPGSAIGTGCVDIILPPEKIAQQIENVIQSPQKLQRFQEGHARTDIQELLFLLRERTGVDFKDYKHGTLYRRINRRMAACSTMDVVDYLAYIEDNPRELDQLYNDILICVTHFFRNESAFTALRQRINESFSGKKNRDSIRVWVPGCATGEEAYSIAIMFAEAAGGIGRLAENNFQLFATDIDPEVLAHARRGVYPEATMQNVEKSVRMKYFDHKDHTYEVLKPLRELLIFSKHNVFEDPPFLRLDLISCRNLLIYFNSDLQSRVLSRFHYALKSKGTLLLGKSESLGQSAKLFQTVDSKAKLFESKSYSVEAEKAPAIFRDRTKIEAPPVAAKKSSMYELPDAVIKALAPDSLLVNEDMDVIRIFGDVRAYTELEPGNISTNLMSLCKKEFRQEVRALIYKALRENIAESYLPKKVQLDGNLHSVNLTLRLLDLNDASERLILLSFQREELNDATPGLLRADDNDTDPRFAELEQELAVTKEHLQTVVEELETSNEELQSTNEELQSANEELQSSNEELETSNEELQSTNEELMTVNEELQIKTAEITDLYHDLYNVKESYDFPMLVVSRSLKLKHFNQSACDIFFSGDNPTHEELDAYVTDLETSLAIPNLGTNILQVIKSGDVFVRQLDSDDASYLERIIPYRDAQDEIAGAILAYVDNTDSRRVERQLKKSEERYQLAVDGSSVGLWDWDINRDTLYCSPKLLSQLRIDSAASPLSFEFFKGRIHPDDIENVFSVLDAHLDRSFEFNVECRVRTTEQAKLENIQERYIWVHMRGQAVWDEKHKAVRMAGSLSDITERRLILDELRESNSALSRFAYVCSHDLQEPARIAEKFAQLLSEHYVDKIDSDGQGYLEHIVTSTVQMQEMIQDMLAYAQVERRAEAFVTVDCKAIVADIIESLALVADGDMAETDRPEIIIGDLPKISADRIQIIQLFKNLINNAIKFNRSSAPRVVIDCVDKNDQWVFSVQDNGIGLKKEDRQKIFNVFQRLNRQEDFPGTGIGLSICRKIIHQHCGRIWVESISGAGSTFYFELPKKLSRRIANDSHIQENFQPQ